MASPSLKALLVSIAFFSQAVATAEVTGIKAFHREGQTFITFTEDAAASGEQYRVYRSGEPITKESLGKAEHIATLLEGSSKFRVNVQKFKLMKEAGITHYQIEDVDKGGKPLTDGTGLLVWTVKKPGKRFYAVVQEQEGKEVGAPTAGKSSLEAALDEAVAVPGAVKMIEIEPAAWVYGYFMDYALWNPRKIDDSITGIGNVCHIVAPTKHEDMKKPTKLVMTCHGLGAVNQGAGDKRTSSRGQPYVRIYNKDFFATWHYGHANSITWYGPNKYDRKKPPTTGVVVDYTWRQIDFMIRWIKKGPKNFPPVTIDDNRVYMTGFSMGGTAGNTVGIRHGDIFAGVQADKGICNWLRTRVGGKQNPLGWQKAVHSRWGKPDTGLKTLDGEDIYKQRMDIPRWLREHPEVQIPFMEIKYGRYDGSIAFEGTPEYFRSLQEGRHAFTGGWTAVSHFPCGGTAANNTALNQPRNESLPAFSWATCNTPLDEEPVAPQSPGVFKGSGTIVDGTTLKATIENKPKRFSGFSKDCKGLWLAMNMVGYLAGGPNFKIVSNTKDTLTIEPHPDFGDLKTAPLLKASKDGKVSFRVSRARYSGVINSRLEWCSSGNNFDKTNGADDIVDEPKRWEVQVRLATYPKGKKAREYRPHDPDATCTVDITPRRLQKFKIKQGDKIKWVNMNYADPKSPKELAKGEVETDKWGLVTVKKFHVSKKGWGNRLILTLD